MQLLTSATAFLPMTSTTSTLKSSVIPYTKPTSRTSMHSARPLGRPPRTSCIKYSPSRPTDVLLTSLSTPSIRNSPRNNVRSCSPQSVGCGQRETTNLREQTRWIKYVWHARAYQNIVPSSTTSIVLDRQARTTWLLLPTSRTGSSAKKSNLTNRRSCNNSSMGCFTATRS